jgi:hypothetical protein
MSCLSTNARPIGKGQVMRASDTAGMRAYASALALDQRIVGVVCPIRVAPSVPDDDSRAAWAASRRWIVPSICRCAQQSVTEIGTQARRNPAVSGASRSGRYRARTSDLRLVEQSGAWPAMALSRGVKATCRAKRVPRYVVL